MLWFGTHREYGTACARNNFGDFVVQVSGPLLFGTYVHDDKICPNFVSHLKNTR